jgi:hypothetical protein
MITPFNALPALSFLVSKRRACHALRLRRAGAAIRTQHDRLISTALYHPMKQLASVARALLA